MNAYELYLLYAALRAHFETSYNYVKYSGKIRRSVQAFEKRSDVYYFKRWAKKLANKKEAIQFVTGNLLADQQWFGDFSLDNLRQFRKQLENLSYVFGNELDKMILDSEVHNKQLGEWFQCVDSNHPPILKGYLRRQISIETLIILNVLGGIFSKFDAGISEGIVWPLVKQKCEKYAILLSFTESQINGFRQILKTKMEK
jgi:hypothetical protein